MIEFALVVPLFALFLFAIVDFGLLFAGYTTMRAGVQAGARLASVDEYLPSSGSIPCSWTGVDQQTADMVCLIAQRIGTTLGTKPGTLEIGLDASVVVGGEQSVEVCASAAMTSTTGITAPFLNGRTLASSSTLRLEQSPSFADFAPSSPTSPSVVYGTGASSVTISPRTCPAPGA